MDRRPGGYRLGFLVAWTLLVLVVALGFWIQSRIIEENRDLIARVERQGRAVAALVERSEQRRAEQIEVLCGLELALHPEDEAEVVEAFARAGIACSP